MKNSSSEKTLSKASERIRMIAVLAILSAAGIALGKFLQIPIGNSLRISFENLPSIFAGIVFGPLQGAAVGAVEDLVGSFMAGYDINPLITLGAISCGFFAGLAAQFTVKDNKLSIWRVILPVFAGHLIGSMLIKTIGLRLAYAKPWSVLAFRVPLYLANTAAESLIIYFLLRSRAVRSALKGFKTRPGVRGD